MFLQIYVVLEVYILRILVRIVLLLGFDFTDCILD